MRSVKDLTSAPLVRQILVALGPIFITGALGITEGYSAILLPQLQQENGTIKVDSQLASWMASISFIPMAGGCLAGGYLMEKIGRRSVHIWACVTLVPGWFVIAAATNSNAILVGRFLTGASHGLLGPVSGVYIAETSQPNIRGVLLISMAIALNIGILLSHFLGTFFTWRTTALISSLAPIPFAVFMVFMPESPTFLIKRNKIDEAKRAFYWCRGKSSEAQNELNELIKVPENLNDTPKISLFQQMRSLAKPEFWKPTIIMSVLFFTSQSTGSNAIVCYSIQLLQECGLNDKVFDEYFTMIIIDIFRIIFSIIAAILAKKLNRRSLIMLSGYGVTLVLFCLCGYLWLASRISLNSTSILLVLLVSYMCFIFIGLVPLSWTVIGEVFPLAYRGLGTALTSLVGFFFIYLVVQTFFNLLEFFGNIFGVFAFYGTCTLFGTIFLTVFLPETKDKPLYIIEDYFKTKKNTKGVTTMTTMPQTGAN